ncbi:MAG: hypothetical protein WCS99_00980 [Limisphaerales bacterium]
MNHECDGLDDMARETPIMRFVSLVLYQAVADGAEIITFRLKPGGDELPEMTGRRKFEVGYQGAFPYCAMPPPPQHLYSPVICRLCCLADVPYWAKGSVTGTFRMRIGSGTDSKSWSFKLQSSDLLSGLTLTRVSDSELPANDLYAEFTLPEPQPIEWRPAVPAWQVIPVRPMNRHTAWVWSLSRCAFYAAVCALAWALLAAGGLIDSATISMSGLVAGGLLLGMLINWQAGRSSRCFSKATRT